MKKLRADIESGIWAITPSALAVLRSSLEAKETHLRDIKADWFDDRFPARPAVAVTNGCAVVSVQGTIVKGYDEWTCRIFGCCDVDDVRQDIEAALGSAAVTNIILYIDSPGGMVGGVPELTQFIRTASSVKPVYAYTEGMMASSAQWLAMGAQARYGSTTSISGSVGVMIPFLDASAYMSNNGFFVELIKAGTLKGAGVFGTSLSKDQRADWQALVNQVYDMFTGDVLASRNVAPENMQGQCFMGSAAVTAKMIDGIYSTFDAFMAGLTTN